MERSCGTPRETSWDLWENVWKGQKGRGAGESQPTMTRKPLENAVSRCGGWPAERGGVVHASGWMSGERSKCGYAIGIPQGQRVDEANRYSQMMV